MIACIATDDPSHPEFERAEIVTAGSVRARMDEELARHGRFFRAHPNAQMIGEGETALSLMGRWHGEATRLCGYLVRWDIYPVPQSMYAPGADERTWKHLAAAHERAAADAEHRDRAARAGEALRQIDASGRPGLVNWVLGSGLDITSAAAKLRQLHELRERPGIVPLIPAAYQPWQWELATAQAGGSVAAVERELLAEIAARA
jgi:hypothetical protein